MFSKVEYLEKSIENSRDFIENTTILVDGVYCANSTASLHDMHKSMILGYEDELKDAKIEQLEERLKLLESSRKNTDTDKTGEK